MAPHESADRRWQNVVASEQENKDASIESEGRARRDEASELGRNARREAGNEPRIEPLNLPEQPNASRAAMPQTFPATPPASPTDQKNSRKQRTPVSQPPETVSSRVTSLEASINHLQDQIYQQTLRIESIRGTILSLQQQQHDVTSEQIAAIQSGNDQEISKYKKREEELVDMIKRKETRMTELENEIDRLRTRKGELERDLRDAESEAQRRERWLREQLDDSEAKIKHTAEEGQKKEEFLSARIQTVEDENNTIREQSQRRERELEEQLQDAKQATEEVRNAKSTSLGVGTMDGPWEFRRKRGSNITTLSAALRTGLRIIGSP